MTAILKYTLPVLMLCILAACSDDAATDNAPTATAALPGGKELISFSQEGSTMTRAALTRAGFTSDTKIVMRIKAKDGDNDSYRYTQAIATAGPQTTENDECNTIFGLVGTHSHLNFNTGQFRFWDDAFGRSSQLTVFAVAVPDKNNETVLSDHILDTNGTAQTPVDAATNPNWYTITGTENTKISWRVSTAQTSQTQANEDLAYSNNIRSGEMEQKGRYHQEWNSSGGTWTKSMELGRMSWQAQTEGDLTTGKYDQGHLVFKHALTWLTIVLTEKANTPSTDYGFNNTSSADFQWTKAGASATQNITLKGSSTATYGFPTQGTLDISDGSWSGKTENIDITQLYEETTSATTANQTVRTLHAYVLPGTNLYANTGNAIEFELDHAKYYVKGQDIANAIRTYSSEQASFTTTEAGKHYIIKLTVAKKAVENVTAAILPWEEVNSTEADAKNTYCTFQFEDRNTRLVGDDASKFSIYRAAKDAGEYITDATAANYDWKTGYLTDGAATKTWATNHWTTNWFWEDNRTYYHFRAAGTNSTGTVSIATEGTGDNASDYFTIAAGELDGSDSKGYKDYIWGAPFTYVDNTYKLKYDHSTNGFAYKADGTIPQISGAIGATDSQIKMLLFHTTSKITVDVKTTTGADKVKLCNDNGTPGDTSDDTNATTVEILNFLPSGKVLMGNGLVTASGDRTSAATMTAGTYTPASGGNPDQTTGFTYGMVPQPLTYGGGTVGLRITTPDGNRYLVSDLSTCYATVSPTNLLNPYTTLKDGSSTLYKIDEWYPHYQYHYTITLTKMGIQNLTATLADWENVEAENIGIQIE